MNAQLKDTVTYMKSKLHASNARFGWFEYELGETKRQLGEVNLRTLSLKEKIRNLKAGAELQKEAIVWAEDDATDREIDASFKSFK